MQDLCLESVLAQVVCHPRMFCYHDAPRIRRQLSGSLWIYYLELEK